VPDIGRPNPGILMVEHRAPIGLRILSWGAENITREIEPRLGIPHEEAERLKLPWGDGPQTNGEIGKTVQAAIDTALDELAAAINENWRGAKLYITGRATGYKELPKQLAAKLKGAAHCERLEGSSGGKSPAAIAGLQATARSNGGAPPLVFRLAETRTGDTAANAGRGPLAVWFARVRESRGQ